MTKPTTRSLPLGNGLRSTTLLAGTHNTKGDWVVFLHGFPDNHHSFRQQIPALVEAGYRVACPMMPGYEASSQNRPGHYDIHSVSGQLIHLIDSLNTPMHNGISTVGRRAFAVHLVGHDWGAITGFALVCQKPELFKTYTSLSIPYGLSLKGVLKQAKAYLPNSWYIQLFQLRGIAESLIQVRQLWFIDQLIDNWNPGWDMPASHQSSIRHTLSAPGVLPAALGYYRAIYGLSQRARKSRELLNQRIDVPTLLIQGLKDRSIPPALWNLNHRNLYSQTMHHEQLSCGHWPHQEMAQPVNTLLLNWLMTHG